MYDFPVGYNPIHISNILNSHIYVMRKHDMI